MVEVATLEAGAEVMQVVVAATDESLNQSDKPRPDQPMKFSFPSIRHTTPCGVLLLACACGASPINLTAAQPAQALQTFASPDDAARALKAAADAKDYAALIKLFGPDLQDLSTGDAVQDTNNAKRFATAMDQGYKLTKEGHDKITLEVGPDDWPMPIPLIKADGTWHFDTAAGEEEIMNRHVGKDELHAIGVCRAYVLAQRQYADENPEPGTEGKYARHFHSAPGKRDGLYWPQVKDEPASPFGPLVMKAEAEGYQVHGQGTGPHPFHGYYFRILTRQGEAAPGGPMDYLSHGTLMGGFALVAYPVEWGQSGIMTFIVSQDGKVYQRNLDENSAQLAESMKEYNPDSNWTLVQDEGVLRAASER
jgi:hypothetical protein